MRFRPCIDLHNGKVKQIVGSTFADSNNALPVTNFESERPSSFFAGLFRDDNLPGGHVIMLGTGNKRAAQEALRTFPGGLQVGGGITLANARSFLNEGASHVIVTSFVFSDGAVQRERLRLLEKNIGKNKVVIDLSCRKTDGRYMIVCDRWQKPTGLPLTEGIMAELSAYCDEFLVHAVDVEGKQGGIDIELVYHMLAASPLPVTYAGGIRSLDDLETIRTAAEGRVDVTIGSALDIYGGSLKYADVVAWQRKQEKCCL